MARSPSAPRAWQRMLSGRRLDLLDPSPMDVELSDIAHGLARVARWNGQTSGDHAFSVAQHSLMVEAIAARICADYTPDIALMTLLHDAPEYVIGDMISPFKAVVGGGYKAVEARLAGAIHIRFGLPAITPAKTKTMIKKADTISAYFEATELAGFTPAEARTFFGQPRGITREMLDIEPLTTREAETRFAARFEEIEAERAGKSAGTSK